MNELVKVIHNDIFTDSLVIADGTNIKHISIKELILDYKNEFLQLGTFSVLNRESIGGRPEKYYLINEQQATFLMTLLRNNEITVKFKLELVKQFYKMRQLLLEKQTSQWLETRSQGKLTRKSETDTIKQLVEYAKEQGSIHSDRLYTVYSKLANNTIGVKDRNNVTIMELNTLSLVENIILNCIRESMKQDKHYKAIYQDCKKRLDEFLNIGYLKKVA